MGVCLQKSPFLRARREGLAGTLAARNVGRPVCRGLALNPSTYLIFMVFRTVRMLQYRVETMRDPQV